MIARVRFGGGRWVWLLILALAVAVAVLALRPKPAAAWSDVRDKVVAVERFQVDLVPVDSKSAESVRVAFSPEAVGLQVTDGTHIVASANEVRIYDPKEGQLVELPSVGQDMWDATRSGFAEASEDWNIRTFVKQMEKQCGEENIRISPMFTEQGRRVFRIDAESIDGQDRMAMRVDGVTLLPLQIEASELKDGAWKPALKATIRYNNDVDAGLFAMSVPSGTKVVSVSDELNRAGRTIGKEIGRALSSLGSEIERAAGSLGKPSAEAAR